MRYLLPILVALVSACSPYMGRGSFALISTENTVKEFEVLSRDRTEGSACFNAVKLGLFLGDAVFELALKDALSKVEGAKTLLEVEFKDNGDCVVVSGIPAR